MTRAQFIGLAIIIVISSFAGGATMAWLMKPQMVQAEEEAQKYVEEFHAKTIYAEQIKLKKENDEITGIDPSEKGGTLETTINTAGISIFREYKDGAYKAMDLSYNSLIFRDLTNHFSTTTVRAGGALIHDENGEIKIGREEGLEFIKKPSAPKTNTATSIVMYDNRGRTIWEAPYVMIRD